MDTLIIDIGCSQTKFYLINTNGSLQIFKSLTPPNCYDLVAQTFEMFERSLTKSDNIGKVMVISYSDTAIVEMDNGSIKNYGVFKPGELGWELSWNLPKPKDMFQEIKNLRISEIKRILPISTYIMSKLTGAHDWRTWDYTHASNSGMWNFKRGGWGSAMQPFIDAGIITENVLSPQTEVATDRPEHWYLGGHDSVFATANMIPYSTNPYLSLGTWITASVEQMDKPPMARTIDRYVLGANGTLLNQICFRSVLINKTVKKVLKFFESRLPENVNSAPIKVFGSWTEDLGMLKDHPYLTFEFVENPKSYLQEEAAKCVS